MSGPKLARYRREVLGLSQAQLAYLLGVTVTTVSSWETNRQKPLERVLDLALGYLTEHPEMLPPERQVGRPRQRPKEHDE